MKTNILFISLLIIACNLFCNSHITRFFSTLNDRNIFSIKLETSVGFIKIINHCDTSCVSSTSIEGEFYYPALSKITAESEELKINADIGYLIFELNSKGQLVECRIGKPPKLKEFSVCLKQISNELNTKYKLNEILVCNNRMNNGNSFIEFPLKFKIDE